MNPSLVGYVLVGAIVGLPPGLRLICPSDAYRPKYARMLASTSWTHTSMCWPRPLSVRCRIAASAANAACCAESCSPGENGAIAGRSSGSPKPYISPPTACTISSPDR